MKEMLFWRLIKRYNELMKEAITGPNCIDPEICKGDCCSIKIDVSKILAEEYVKRGWANKEDFIRSDVFSFHLRFDEKKGKCFLKVVFFLGCEKDKRCFSNIFLGVKSTKGVFRTILFM